MKSILLLTLVLISCMPSKTLIGNWKGDIETNQGTLNVTMKVTQNETDQYIIKIDNPVMNQFDIITTDIVFEDDVLEFKIPSLNGSYVGQLSEDAKSLSGILSLNNGEEYEFEVKIED